MRRRSTAASFTTLALFADTSYWGRVSDATSTVDSGTATVFVTNGPIGYSSALTPCDDRFNRLAPLNGPGDPIQLSGQNVSFKLFRFRVSTPGSYRFQLTTSGFNGVLFLYQGIFLPTAANVNFSGNSAVGASVNLTQTLLASNNVMHLVVAQFNPSDLGTFSVTVSGPAFVTKLPAPVITAPLQNVILTRGQLASFNAGPNGAFSGAPTQPGSFAFTVQTIDANGCTGTQDFILQVNCQSIAVSAPANNTAPVNSPFSAQFTQTGGIGTTIFSTASALPGGMPLAGSGNLSGCPAITLPDLPGGAPGQLYNHSVSASPAGSYSYAVTAGSLPPGLTLFGGFGLLFGHPTTAGTFNFTLTASGLGDSNNCTGSRGYTVLISGAASRSLVFGDFDGDGKADLSVWRGLQGDWMILNSGDDKSQTTRWGSGNAPYHDEMVAGDYDGDGKMDLAVFRRSTGQWLIKGSQDGAIISAVWGIATDAPVAADYDGDGKTDIAVWRGADTNWHIRRSSDGQEETVSWGTSNTPYRDVPVHADYDGDGLTDIAVFRRASGKDGGYWYIRQSSDGSVVSKTWGLGSDVPVAADYDGDGKADIAVWRGADTHWHILRSSDGIDSSPRTDRRHPHASQAYSVVAKQALAGQTIVKVEWGKKLDNL